MMTVRELIALLQTFPPDIPVTGYNGQECTDFVTTYGVKLDTATERDMLTCDDGSIYVGPHVDIMGY